LLPLLLRALDLATAVPTNHTYFPNLADLD